VGQQSDRPIRAHAHLGLHQIPDSPVEGDMRRAEVVSPSKICQIDMFRGPERMRIKYVGEFGQIQIYHVKPVLKCIEDRRKSSMPDFTLV